MNIARCSQCGVLCERYRMHEYWTGLSMQLWCPACAERGIRMVQHRTVLRCMQIKDKRQKGR